MDPLSRIDVLLSVPLVCGICTNVISKHFPQEMQNHMLFSKWLTMSSSARGERRIRGLQFASVRGLQLEATSFLGSRQTGHGRTVQGQWMEDGTENVVDMDIDR